MLIFLVKNRTNFYNLEKFKNGFGYYNSNDYICKELKMKLLKI